MRENDICRETSEMDKPRTSDRSLEHFLSASCRDKLQPRGPEPISNLTATSLSASPVDRLKSSRARAATACQACHPRQRDTRNTPPKTTASLVQSPSKDPYTSTPTQKGTALATHKASPQFTSNDCSSGIIRDPPAEPI